MGEPAGAWIRLAARAIDVISIFLIMMVFTQVLTLFLSNWVASLAISTLTDILTVLGVVFYLAYFAIRETTSGQSLGKMTLSLKVFGPTGNLLTLSESLRRNIFGLSPLLALVPGIGANNSSLITASILASVGLTIAMDKVNDQGWHDKFAGGTKVRRVPRPVMPRR